MRVNIPRYPLAVKAKLMPTDPTQRIRDRITNEARDTPEKKGMGIDSIRLMTRHPVARQVKRYEDEDQSERM